jgi:protein TonB
MLVHTTLILLAVVGTQRPPVVPLPKHVESITPIYTPVPDQPVVRRAPATESPATLTHRTFSPPRGPLTYIDSVPTTIDAVLGATAPVRDELEWGPGVPTSEATFRRRGGTGGPGVDGIPFAEGVDKPAIAVAGNPVPQYPEILQRAGIQGTVTIQVVVDTTGRAEMGTLLVLSSDHQLFQSAVIGVLPRMRFLPAVSADRKVKMWVIMPFVFEVRR